MNIFILHSTSIVVFQFLCLIQLFVTPWATASQAPLSSSVSWSLFQFMSIESVVVSNHHILCCPRLLLPSIFTSIRVFSNELALHIKCPKYWTFKFSISPSKEYSGLISLGVTGLISLLFKGLRSLLHITVQKHQFFYFDWDYLVLAARPLLMFSPFFRLLFPFFLFQLNPTILLLQEGGPLPGPKTGLLSNTPRRHMCWQSKRLYWERVPGWRAVG